MTQVDPVAEQLRAIAAGVPSRIDLGLDRVITVAERLDRPQDRMPPAIHVAGTNGKGSTIAFIRALADQIGWNVHCFTSPGPARIGDVSLSGKPATDAQLLTALARIQAVCEDVSLTEFEALTLAAYLLMADHPAQMAVIEVGMGGLEDSTNILGQTAKVGAITCVSYDHRDFLGTTIQEIAVQKAGIIQPGQRVVIGPQLYEEAEQTLLSEAERLGASPILLEGRDWDVERSGDNFIFNGPLSTLYLPIPSLNGPHQLGNAGTALVAMGLFPDMELTNPTIARGLTEARWPGRLQRITRGPLLEPFEDRPDGWSVWIDGGHNDSAGEALALWAEETRDLGPLHLVVAMLGDKSPREFLSPLVSETKSFRAVPLDVPGRPAHGARVMVEYARSVGHNAIAPYTSIAQAMGEMVHREAPGRVLVTGSLALIAPFLNDGD